MNTHNRFTDKVAFVTGAGSGIGRATALAFAAEGARVVVADLPEGAFAVGHTLVVDGGLTVG